MDVTEYDNKTSNNCRKSENNIQIVIPIITIILCGLLLICLISLMVYTLIKPLLTKEMKIHTSIFLFILE